MAVTLFLYLSSLFFTFFQGQLLQLRLQECLDEISETIATWSHVLAFAESHAGVPLTELAEEGLIAEALEGNGTAVEHLLQENTELPREVGRFLLEKGSAVLWQAGVREWLIRELDDDLPGRTALKNDLAGLSLSGSSLHDRSIDLVLSYEVCSAVHLPLSLSYPVVQRSCRRLWIGTQGSLAAQEEQAEEARVYVTPKGSVYHVSLQCRILDIAPRAVPAEDLSRLRNEGGARYHPCESCLAGKNVREGLVYVTNYGTRYHAGLACVKIDRQALSLPLSEAAEKYRPCFYCVKTAGGR